MKAPANILTAATVTGFVFGPSPVTIAVAVTASLMPDIDMPQSTAGRIPIVPSLINTIFGHRTATHSLTALIITSLAVKTVSPELALAWAIGYGIHILLDMLTPQGVMFFWPYPAWVGTGILKTGGIFEVLYTLALAALNTTSVWGKTLWTETAKKLIELAGSLIPF